MKQMTLIVAVLAALTAPAYSQQSTSDHSAHHPARAQDSATLTDGEIRKVDRDAQKLTIRHGPILNLEMPAMTMVFQVKDPAMLEKINAGDKIKFFAEKTGGAYIVTRIGPGT